MMTLSKITAMKMRLHNSSVKIGSFNKELSEFLRKNNIDEDICPEIVPDAFILKDRTLTLYEIEDTNYIDINKLNKLVDLWYLLDCEGIFLQVIVTNRYGNNQQILDMEDYYLLRLENRGRF